MKNKKATLSELKVKSFVTDIEKETAHTAKGGDTILCYSNICDTLANCVTEAIQGCSPSVNQQK
jgi:hypothetical protein